MQTRLGLASAFLCGLALISNPAKAEENCDEDTFCIETVRKGDVVTFLATNLKSHMPLTFRINVELDNMRQIPAFNGPHVIGPGEQKRLFELKARKAGPWEYAYEYFWTRGDFRAVHDDDFIYRLPFPVGTAFEVSQGCNEAFSHNGEQRYAVDFGMDIGTAIHAARDGVVVDVEESSSSGGEDEAAADQANYIIIQHDDLTFATYYHLRKNGARVEPGDSVRAGDRIGSSGNTGFSSGPHLHFDVSKAMDDAQTEATLRFNFETRQGVVSCPAAGTRLRHP